MASDPIAALLGLGTADEQQTRALADSLRGRQRGSELFSLSFDPQVQQMAQNEQTAVETAANRAGSMRQQGLQRALQQKMQDERLADQRGRDLQQRNWDLADEQRLRKQTEADRYREEVSAPYTTFVNPNDPSDMTRARWQDGELIDDRGVVVDIHGKIPIDELDALSEGASGASPYAQTGDAKYGSASERKQHVEVGKAAKLLDSAVSRYEDWEPMAPGVGLVQDLDIYGTRVGWWGDENEQKRAEWWADYQKYIENPERNEMFGATLTDNELATWNKSSVNPSQDPKYVRHRLEMQREIAQSVAETAAINALEMGASVTQIRNNFPTIDVDRMLRELSEGNYFENRADRFDAYDRRISEIQAAEEEGRDVDTTAYMTEEEMDREIARLEAQNKRQ